MSKRKNNAVRISRAKVTDSDRKIYAILREEFTAADLQMFTEIEPLIPVDHVLANLEKWQKAKPKIKKKS